MVISWFLTIENSLNELFMQGRQQHRIFQNSWILTLLLASNVLKAQNFTLIGTVKNADGVKAYLNYDKEDGVLIRDSSIIVNGQFRFEGIVLNPTSALLRVATPVKFSTIFYLDTGSINIRCCDSLVVTGSKPQMEADSLQNLNAEPMKRIETYLDIQRNLPYDTNDSLSGKSISLIKKELDKMIQFQNKLIVDNFLNHISNNTSSFVSAYTLNMLLYTKRLTARDAQIIYEKLSPEIKKSNIGTDISREIDSRLGGLKIDNITFKDQNDRSYQLLTIGKKKILVHFWASWCIPCIKEFPALKALLARHPDVVCVAISLDQDTAAWKKAITKYRLEKWVHSLSNSEWKKTFTNVSMPIPSSVVINKDGLILDNTLATKTQLLTELEKVLRR